jgi:hypothetical protein
LKYGDAGELFGKGRIVQMDRLGEASAAQMEFALLAGLEHPVDAVPASATRLLLLADVNRANYRPMPLAQLAQMAKMSGVDSDSFGPIWVYVLEKNQ